MNSANVEDGQASVCGGLNHEDAPGVGQLGQLLLVSGIGAVEGQADGVQADEAERRRTAVVQWPESVSRHDVGGKVARTGVLALVGAHDEEVRGVEPSEAEQGVVGGEGPAEVARREGDLVDGRRGRWSDWALLERVRH